jgi:hypothetical protein
MAAAAPRTVDPVIHHLIDLGRGKKLAFMTRVAFLPADL